MRTLPTDITSLISAEKRLLTSPVWDVRRDPRYFQFLHPLSTDGVTVGGFELRAKISKQFISRDAMVQIEYSPSGRRDATELWRIDWKPFHVHTNTGHPKDCPYDTIDGTHEHPFYENYLASRSKMRSGSLPAARLIQNDIQSLSNFLAFCGDRLKIVDMYRIAIPADSGDLIWATK
jgi:hypothetical protein